MCCGTQSWESCGVVKYYSAEMFSVATEQALGCFLVRSHTGIIQSALQPFVFIFWPVLRHSKLTQALYTDSIEISEQLIGIC